MSYTGTGNLEDPGAVLLVSCYELGHQPHGITSPLAFLRSAGFQPTALDLAIETPDSETLRGARFVGISVPMHTALRVGVRVAKRMRELNPDCHICFYGLYAPLNAGYLLDGIADSVLGGEYEEDLVRLVSRLERGEQPDTRSQATLTRIAFQKPIRDSLPPFDRYAHLEHQGVRRLAGYVEASRGCLHHCKHCPIPAVYDGRLFVVPETIVLDDIRSQVQAGAQHITFGDADFLNGPSHSLRIVRAMHEEFPNLTFDFTAKVEHVLCSRDLMPELGSLGAVFMVTAVESLSDTVLTILDKGHTRSDVTEALGILREAGIAMRPSLLPFTPWSSLADFIDILDFVEHEKLVDHIDPVQYSIRLLVPPGSLLLASPDMQPHLGPLNEESLSYAWSHPDPRMDTLQQDIGRVVEEAAQASEDPVVTFYKIRTLAAQTVAAPLAERPAPSTSVPGQGSPNRDRARPPRLTESWFC